MNQFASGTKVSIESSQSHIKSTLRRYGCDGFGVFERKDKASIAFEIKGLNILIEVPLPPFEEFETARRSEAAQFKAQEQAIKQRWRALLLAIRAKLEAVETGISTLEKEFMPFVVMPDGRVLADHILPQLQKAVATGKMPKLLPSF